ncbi:testis-specific serine/threonine-protein kinase 1-like [Centruroides sculpturatus]|uniref:testis-specific serine/threonine-protein kinase 1-like n=1 Tax=Centruroides sculpturatus TaxID=218467 RepID=UPI000C6CE2B0|nr:testis-specific serine/threonine-protein kinase 1-like [Centruroides sculpturatus]
MPLSDPHRHSISISSATGFLNKNGYRLGSIIGEGSYCKVREAEYNGEKLAIKIISRIKNSNEYIKKFLPRELKILCKINHPNIIEIKRIIDFGTYVYICMEIAEKGDLFDCIKKHNFLSENRARKYFYHLVQAVNYLHKNHISHRDLKCENVLITSNDIVKLTDFSFSRVCINENTGRKILSETYYGSTAYTAPEVLLGIPYDPMMIDAWSMGCILFIMITGMMPYNDSNPRKMIQYQLERRYPIPSSLNKQISSQCNKLIFQLLEPDVMKRTTVENVLRSSWFQQ